MNEQERRVPGAQALGKTEAALARVELYDTLGQLRDRLNYAQRVDNAMERAQARVRETKRTRPLVFAAGCASVAAAAGVAVWGIAQGISRYIR